MSKIGMNFSRFYSDFGSESNKEQRPGDALISVRRRFNPVISFVCLRFVSDLFELWLLMGISLI